MQSYSPFTYWADIKKLCSRIRNKFYFVILFSPMPNMFSLFFRLYLVRHNLFAMYSSRKALSNICDARIYWQCCLVLPYVTVLILIIYSSFSLSCCIFCFQSWDWRVMCFLVSHQIVLLALDRKGILILSNNNRSLKFDSSATYELSPQGEKKAITSFFCSVVQRS